MVYQSTSGHNGDVIRPRSMRGSECDAPVCDYGIAPVHCSIIAEAKNKHRTSCRILLDIGFLRFYTWKLDRWTGDFVRRLTSTEDT